MSPNVATGLLATEEISTKPKVPEALRQRKELKLLSRAEVAQESERTGYTLIIIHDKIYNVTNWIPKHPGGEFTIKLLNGKDATDSFFGTHPSWVSQRYLPSMEYGKLKDGQDLSKITQDFRLLTQKMHDEGLFETNLWYYVAKVSVILCILGVSVAGVLYGNSFWVHVFSGAVMGLFWQQMAFVGHDAGHNGITHDRVKDSCIGLFVGNFTTGLSIGWWKRNHNVHHIVTNSIDNDPDIQHLPIFAITPAFLTQPIFSTFYKRILPLTGVTHLLIGVQHFLYYPVMAVARFNLYAQSLLHALGCGPYSQDNVWHREWQIGTLLGFWVWISLLLAQLPDWNTRFWFFLIAHNVAGILHVQITLSHFAMPTYFGVPYDNTDNGYLVTQLKTSMNVDSDWTTDWFHGGLQFQVEHHLWPRLPRHNLRKAKNLLVPLCEKHGLEYSSYGFVEANRKMLANLRETAMHAKCFSEFFWDAINLRG
eukprot:comp19043_c1_seq1/m.21477 comp19043_c1_seq1/g.21477  ORF comp19043_c1_seq1/g.21477 comp19043_c1_seq1/m.21477 type:complete len:480 (-) comp19043_c1_seq1:113-1552(-)